MNAAQGDGVLSVGFSCYVPCLSFPACKTRGWVARLYLPHDGFLMPPLGFWQGSYSFHGI